MSTISGTELSLLASIVTKNLLRFAAFREALLGPHFATGMKKTTCSEFGKLVLKSIPNGTSKDHCIDTAEAFLEKLANPEQPIEVFVHLRSLQISFNIPGYDQVFTVKSGVSYESVNEHMISDVQQVVAKLAALNWDKYSKLAETYKPNFDELRNLFIEIAFDGIPNKKRDTALFYDAEWPLEELEASISRSGNIITVKTVFGICTEAVPEPKVHQSDVKITPEPKAAKSETKLAKSETKLAKSETKLAKSEVLVCNTDDTDPCNHLAIKLLQKATYEDVINHALIATPKQVSNLFSAFSRSVRYATRQMPSSEILSEYFSRRGNVIVTYKAWEAHGHPQDFIQELVQELSFWPNKDSDECVREFIQSMDVTSLAAFILRLAKAYAHKITWEGYRNDFFDQFRHYFDEVEAQIILKAL